MYKVSILSIGDELCIGQTVNTNASWMSQQLVKVGAEIITHSTIHDSRREIVSEIDRLSKISDLILVTGGLGPTHDDITKKVLLEYFNDEAVINEEVLKYLKEYFRSRGREFLDRHYGQAMLPSKSMTFPNKVGTAPGMLFENDDFALLSMPGVPREMKYIINNSLISYVRDKIKENKLKVNIFRTIRTSGIPESTLAEKIGDLDFLNGASLAFLPSYKGVKLRLGVINDSFEGGELELDSLEEFIRSKVNDFITNSEDLEINEIIGDLLTDQNKTVSVAESCTGGLLGSTFTETPGSSKYFMGGIISYSNEAKMEFLGVQKNTLKSYGAVSEETALEMANGVRNKFGTNYSLSITGLAGPDGGSEDKPVGTVWIGFSSDSGNFAKKYVFSKDRQVNRELSASQAMSILFNEIKNK